VAAHVLHGVVGNDDGIIVRLITEILEVVEQDHDGSEFIGEGLASFCVILLTGLLQHWESVYENILSFRSRLVQQNPLPGTTHRTFCVHIVTYSLYFDHLTKKIPLDVFTGPVMQLECRATIDYFIARSSSCRANPLTERQKSVDSVCVIVEALPSTHRDCAEHDAKTDMIPSSSIDYYQCDSNDCLEQYQSSD
jgi:hypothetical protein